MAIAVNLDSLNEAPFPPRVRVSGVCQAPMPTQQNVYQHHAKCTLEVSLRWVCYAVVKSNYTQRSMLEILLIAFYP